MAATRFFGQRATSKPVRRTPSLCSRLDHISKVPFTVSQPVGAEMLPGGRYIYVDCASPPACSMATDQSANRLPGNHARITQNRIAMNGGSRLTLAAKRCGAQCGASCKVCSHPQSSPRLGPAPGWLARLSRLCPNVALQSLLRHLIASQYRQSSAFRSVRATQPTLVFLRLQAC